MVRVIYPDTPGVPAGDRGLAYGDGLFETMRIFGQRVRLRSLHLRRMVHDAGRLGIDIDSGQLDRALDNAVRQLASQDDGASCILKMMLTRGSGGRGYRPTEPSEPHLIFSVAPLPSMPDKGGVSARCARFPLTVNPVLAGIKTLNRLQQVMASREFSGAEWELIMRDATGCLVEGTRTNLLARLADGWVTPPVTSIAVAGVMREYAMACLKSKGERMTEQALPSDITSRPDFRGLYLLNSVFGAVAVHTLDSVDLPVDGTLATICDFPDTME